jgi:hypothetical protein
VLVSLSLLIVSPAGAANAPPDSSPAMISHQHVNDGTDAAQLISVWSRQPDHEYLGGIEQLSDASDWIP